MNLARTPDESKLTARRKSEYRSLLRAKGRRELGQYLIEGVRAVESAVNAGASLVDLVVDRDLIEEASGGSEASERVASILESVTCPVLIAAGNDLKSVSDVRTSQGIIAAAKLPGDAPAVEFPCVVLDGVQDPGNVGTLVRSAAWFGVRTVICGPGTADPFQPKVVRSSQGGLWDVSVQRMDDLPRILHAVGDRPIFVADLDGQPAAEWRPERESVLVIGSEARGPSAVFRAAAEGVVTIAGGNQKGTESLNAAVAGGILLHCWLQGWRQV